MSNHFYIILSLLFIVHTCHAQVGDSDIRLHVLKANHIGKEYKFIHKDSTVTYLRYLGKVHTRTGITYKVLNSVWIWGFSHRATSRILIFNNNNRYIGNYYITVIDDLPSYIKANQLVFLNTNRSGNDCDSKLITYVNFNRGLPKELFRKCKDQSGDIYSFERD